MHPSVLDTGIPPAPPHAVVATALPLLDGGPKRLAHGVFATLTRGEVKLPHDPKLPPDVAAPAPPPARLEDVEAATLRQALTAAAGNISAVAQRLGVARSTVYRMMRRAGLRAPDDPG